jgi:hypothetical protein
MPGDRGTFLAAATCVAVLAASLLLPRIFQDTGGGFAASTSAALLFMALAAVAAIASFALLVRTLRHRRMLSSAALIAGVLPAALVAVGTVALSLWVPR